MARPGPGRNRPSGAGRRKSATAARRDAPPRPSRKAEKSARRYAPSLILRGLQDAEEHRGEGDSLHGGCLLSFVGGRALPRIEPADDDGPIVARRQRRTPAGGERHAEHGTQVVIVNAE